MKNRFIYLLLLVTFSHDFVNAQFDDVELNFNLGSSFRTLVVNNENNGTSAVLASRKEREKRDLALSVQILSSKNLGNKFELKYGAGLYNYKYVLNEEKNVRWPSEITSQGYVQNPDLPREVTVTSSNLYIDLPILLRYNLNLGKLGFFVGAGISPEFYLGNGISTFTDLSSIKYAVNSNFRRVNLSPLAEIGMRYKLSDKFSIIGKANARQQLFNITNDTPISEKLNSYGFSIGVIYK